MSVLNLLLMVILGVTLVAVVLQPAVVMVLLGLFGLTMLAKLDD